MRQSQKNNRSRNKSGRKSNGPSPNRVYESNGPEGKVRGTPQQIIEKYQSLSRDKFTAGDRILAESYLQFAEHYTRILNAAQPRREEREEEPEAAVDEAGAMIADENGEGPAKPRSTNDAAPEGLAVIGEEETSDIVATPESLSERRRPARRRADPAAADEDEETKRPRRRVGRKPKAESQPQLSEPDAAQTADAAPASEDAGAAPESPAQVLI